VKFILLLMERDTNWNEVPEERLEEALGDHASFERYLRENGISYYGEAVGPSTAAKTLRRTEDGLSLSDGPWTEQSAGLGGLYVIDVKDMDAAVEVARRCPTGAATEIRPIWASSE
jgi:hypothetical protein